MFRALARVNGNLVSSFVKPHRRIAQHLTIYHQISWRQYCNALPCQDQKKSTTTEAKHSTTTDAKYATTTEAKSKPITDFKPKPNCPDAIIKPQKSKVNPEVGIIKQFLFNKYFVYVQNYASNILERQFPEAIRIYRVFSVGIKEFIGDFKSFYLVLNKINSSSVGIPRLSRKELELYYQFPTDMRTIAPVLLISALPFMNYIMFPLAYMFPYHLLTHHFWSLQQKSEFLLRDQKKRLAHNKSVFQHLQSQLDVLKINRYHSKWSQVISKLAAGLHPTSHEVVECRSLFGHIPYALDTLSHGHVRSLLKIHAMHTGWRRKARLEQKAKSIYLIDCAILREGGADCLNYDELRYACSQRGLNPTNMKQKDMVEWLKGWLRITEVVTPDNLSLVLHCPVLLAYNHTNNWVLRR